MDDNTLSLDLVHEAVGPDHEFAKPWVGWVWERATPLTEVRERVSRITDALGKGGGERR